ncbi:hypothetical protein JCM33374_g888 [Metschnikowia sp. JCM 33374]|nr:hypothetical protein JCM33374_g888 [Metschnikowia sp. JCM 33374]
MIIFEILGKILVWTLLGAIGVLATVEEPQSDSPGSPEIFPMTIESSNKADQAFLLQKLNGVLQRFFPEDEDINVSVVISQQSLDCLDIKVMKNFKVGSESTFSSEESTNIKKEEAVIEDPEKKPVRLSRKKPVSTNRLKSSYQTKPALQDNQDKFSSHISLLGSFLETEEENASINSNSDEVPGVFASSGETSDKTEPEKEPSENDDVISDGPIIPKCDALPVEKTSFPSRTPSANSKSVFRKLKSLFSPGSTKAKSLEDENDENSHSIFYDKIKDEKEKLFDLGHAEWKYAGPNDSPVGPSEGVDNFFTFTEPEENMVAFGVTDASKLRGMDIVSKGISEKMCFSAKEMYRNHQMLSDVSPLNVLKVSYQEALLDSNVPVGSTAALFGLLDDERRLSLSYTGTPWAAVYREGKFVHSTKLTKDVADEKHQFIKLPTTVKSTSTDFLENHRRKLFERMNEDTWIIEKGDIVLVATDGLYKRMRSEQIKKSLSMCLERGWDMMDTSSWIVEASRGLHPVDTEKEQPFVISSLKTEDIIVLLIKVL